MCIYIYVYIYIYIYILASSLLRGSLPSSHMYPYPLRPPHGTPIPILHASFVLPSSLITTSIPCVTLHVPECYHPARGHREVADVGRACQDKAWGSNGFPSGIIRQSWNDAEKISMAPASG